MTYQYREYIITEPSDHDDLTIKINFWNKIKTIIRCWHKYVENLQIKY